MVELYRENGERRAHDTVSGQTVTLTALQYKMMSYIKPPLTEELPTSLRYDLAKYDSGAVLDAYEEIYKLYCDGVLFAEEK